MTSGAPGRSTRETSLKTSTGWVRKYRADSARIRPSFCRGRPRRYDARNAMTTTARAETVGSLLRPGYLLEARDARRAGTISDEDLRKIEDRAVQEAIELQQSI